MRSRYEKLLDQAAARLEALQNQQTKLEEDLAQAQQEFYTYRNKCSENSKGPYADCRRDQITYASEAVSRAEKDISDQHTYINILLNQCNDYLKSEPMLNRPVAGSSQVGGLFGSNQVGKQVETSKDQDLLQPPSL